jgi:hypothetical protein
MAKASSAADAVPALDFLAEAKPGPLPPFIAVFGDEDFLKRH